MNLLAVILTDKMKTFIFLSMFLCMTSFCMSEEKTTTPCIMYKCASNVYDPVCGKQKKNGCWEERIFQNNCYMLSANSCGKANYVPCVENKCEKPSIPNN